MKILALETANEHCSVALVDDKQQLFYQYHSEARSQTQQILPMIEQALLQTNSQWSDISAIAFSRGPGSFSGVRINAAVVQALAWAHDLAVVPVSTLRALAQHAYRHAQLTAVTTVMDARMHEVYIGQFQLDSSKIMQATDTEKILDYAAAKKWAKFSVVGSGLELIDHQNDTNIRYADARDIAEIARADFVLGQSVTAAQALPVYLRDNAWKKISEQTKT